MLPKRRAQCTLSWYGTNLASGIPMQCCNVFCVYMDHASIGKRKEWIPRCCNLWWQKYGGPLRLTLLTLILFAFFFSILLVHVDFFVQPLCTINTLHSSETMNYNVCWLTIPSCLPLDSKLHKYAPVRCIIISFTQPCLVLASLSFCSVVFWLSTSKQLKTWPAQFLEEKPSTLLPTVSVPATTFATEKLPPRSHAQPVPCLIMTKKNAF